MRSVRRPLIALLAPLCLSFCNDSNSNSVSPAVNGAVSMLDQCDSASFNAGIGAGTCTRQGNETFSAFNAELAASQTVAAWRFDPATLTLSAGGMIVATNNGGEVHTFTLVNSYGGGVEPSLNTASGNPTEAPECMQLPAAALIAPGGTFTTPAITTAGTYRYQCCIHPWMRTTVTVTGP